MVRLRACQVSASNVRVVFLNLFSLFLLLSPSLPAAGTISGEEVPIVSKTNIKEYRDSFSCEKFTFRSNPNITFYVYVSNFSWPIKIQVRVRHLHTLHLYLLPDRLCLPNCSQKVTVLHWKEKKKVEKVEEPLCHAGLGVISSAINCNYAYNERCTVCC